MPRRYQWDEIIESLFPLQDTEFFLDEKPPLHYLNCLAIHESVDVRRTNELINIPSLPKYARHRAAEQDTKRVFQPAVERAQSQVPKWGYEVVLLANSRPEIPRLVILQFALA